MSKHDAVERLQSIPMFAELSSRELKRVSKLMTQIEVREGRDLTTEGVDPDREFFPAGQGAGMFDELRPAADIVTSMVAEAEATLARLTA